MKVLERGDLPEYLLQRTTIDPLTNCWTWVGAKNNGYGTGSIGGTQMLVHRFAYKSMVGPIPSGITLDHLCRNRACVNPAHLEPVSRGENTLRGNTVTGNNKRKTHCKRGHALSGENLSSYTGHRICLSCRRDYVHDRMKDPERRDAVNKRRRELRAERRGLS